MSPLDQSRVRVNVGPSTQPGHWPGMSSHNSQPCGIADLLQRSQTIGLECHERGEPEKMAAFCRQRSQANGLECHSRAPSARTSRRPSTVARPTAWNVTGRLRCRVWRIPAFNEARPKGRECHAYAILSSALSRCLQRSQANGLESHARLPGLNVVTAIFVSFANPHFLPPRCASAHRAWPADAPREPVGFPPSMGVRASAGRHSPRPK